MSRLLAGRYQLVELIGAGGAATVHRAVDRRLGREVAVKLLNDNVARTADPAGRERFLHEARSAARLDNPHLVTVFDAGEDGGDLFLVMELVVGRSLAQVIAADAPLPADVATSIAVQMLVGLSAAHAAGTIHRDVKPANVLVDAAGHVRIADFGIAKRLDDIESSLTATGTVVGTPAYLAPEQAMGAAGSAATDLHAVALVLYEMLTGELPAGRRGQSDPALGARVTGPFDPRSVRPDVPAGVALAVIRATEPEPARRPDVDELVAMLGGRPRSDPGPAAAAAHVGPAAGPAGTAAMPLDGGTLVMSTKPGSVVARVAGPGSRLSVGAGGSARRRAVGVALLAVVTLGALIVLAAALDGGNAGQSPAEPTVAPVGMVSTTLSTQPPLDTTAPPTTSPDQGNGNANGRDKGKDKGKGGEGD